MRKDEIALLERAFGAEIDAALSGVPSTRLVQTKSKLAARLAEEGFLAVEEQRLGGRFPVTLSGYVLTQVGRLAYCMEACE